MLSVVMATTADMAFYIDGSAATPKPSGAGGAVHQTGDDFMIGRRAIGAAFFHGVIDEVRIYSRALASSEVYSLANP